LRTLAADIFDLPHTSCGQSRRSIVMSSTVICNPTASAIIHRRSARLAERLERGARELADFARSLTDAEWRTNTPSDGRTVGVIVHHVATVYPLEVHLATMMAAGTPIVGITSETIREMNAAHATEHANATKEQTLVVLEENSSAAALAIRAFSDEDLDRAVPVSLYAHAELTCQFMLEDHAVRHSYHHLSRLRAAIGSASARPSANRGRPNVKPRYTL
jgi:hypothetical protein